MTRLLLGLVSLSILNACGMLNKLEGQTEAVYSQVEATNKHVESTNNKLEETKNGQALGEALNLMSDREVSPNLRAAAAESVYVKAPEERIAKYIGAPGPLDRLSIPFPSGLASMVTLPNVSLVGAKHDDITLAPVDDDLHGIQTVAAVNLLKQMSAESKMPGLVPARLDYLRTLYPRARNVATAVVGAVSMEKIRELIFPKEEILPPSDEELARREKKLEAQRQLKLETAYLLREVAHSLGLPQEEIDRTEPLIEARLGVSR